jgi:hypothetical protein
MGPDGLRHTPPECLDCDRKTECLRAAVAGEQGVAVHEERLERASQAGSVGFLERWARKKTLEGLKRKGGVRSGWWKRLRRARRSEPPDEG